MRRLVSSAEGENCLGLMALTVRGRPVNVCFVLRVRACMCVWENASVRYTVHPQNRYMPSVFKPIAVPIPISLSVSRCQIWACRRFPLARAGSVDLSNGICSLLNPLSPFFSLYFYQPGLFTTAHARSDLTASIRPLFPRPAASD